MSIKDRSIKEVKNIYNLEIERIVEIIKRENVKRVLLQFPDGMKPYSQVICDEIERLAGCECFIWLDSCFGGCDVPIEVENVGIELIIQFGHTEWNFPKDKEIKIL